MKYNSSPIEVTRDNILKYASSEEIYKFYCPKFKVNASMSSPFREDKNPSFIIKKSGYFRDFATGEWGDCFRFVEKLYNIDHDTALRQIVYDLNLTPYFKTLPTTKLPTIRKEAKNVRKNTISGDFKLNVTKREWQDYDYEYWNSYGISAKYLRLGKIIPISFFFINGRMYQAEKYAYAFIEYKDNKLSFKIYQPYSYKIKWLNSNDYSVWDLWHLLPKEHDTLIITSSRKDALSIIENIKVPSTSFQSETIVPKEHVIKDILKRFKNVYLLFDNDYTKDTNWGQKHGLNLSSKYNLKNICIPTEYEAKDFSDLVAKYGRAEASKILKSLL